jgi:hypothetical protein
MKQFSNPTLLSRLTACCASALLASAGCSPTVDHGSSQTELSNNANSAAATSPTTKRPPMSSSNRVKDQALGPRQRR